MSKSNKVPPKAAKVLGLGNTPPKAAKVLGMGMNSAAKKVTSAKAPTPTPKPGFTKATPTTTGKMKLGAPVMGAARGATPQGVNAQRMKDTIKKLGM
jgi:hypothetical protein